MTIYLNDEEIATLLRNMMLADEAQVRSLALLESPSQAEFSEEDTGEPFSHMTVIRLWESARRLEFSCYSCRTRKLASEWTRDSSGVDLCADCLSEAELENEHSDGHHEDEKRADCILCFPDTTA